MAKQIFFNSSLPRSGSTLFSNIVGQDNRFYVTPTSGLVELIYASREIFSKSNEFKAQESSEMDAAFKSFCLGGINGFFEPLTNKKYILDKSRGWSINFGFIQEFYNEPKMVAMVRDPVDIFCSMEKKFRSSNLMSSMIQNHSELKNTTLEKRIDFWVSTPPVGLALERLQEIIRMGYHNKMLFIKYEELCLKPQLEMDRFYDFINIEKYNKFNFSNIMQVTKEDDSVYGVFGDHLIRNEVKPNKSNADVILGEGLIQWIKNRYSWYYEFFNY